MFPHFFETLSGLKFAKNAFQHMPEAVAVIGLSHLFRVVRNLHEYCLLRREDSNGLVCYTPHVHRESSTFVLAVSFVGRLSQTERDLIVDACLASRMFEIIGKAQDVHLSTALVIAKWLGCAVEFTYFSDQDTAKFILSYPCVQPDQAQLKKKTEAIYEFMGPPKLTEKHLLKSTQA